MQNPRGEPRGFIGATNARRATVRLDLRACHTHRYVTSRDTRTRSLSLPEKSRRVVRLPPVDQDSLSPSRGHGSQSFSLRPT